RGNRPLKLAANRACPFRLPAAVRTEPSQGVWSWDPSRLHVDPGEFSEGPGAGWMEGCACPMMPMGMCAPQLGAVGRSPAPSVPPDESLTLLLDLSRVKPTDEGIEVRSHSAPIGIIPMDDARLVLVLSIVEAIVFHHIIVAE